MTNGQLLTLIVTLLVFLVTQTSLILMVLRAQFGAVNAKIDGLATQLTSLDSRVLNIEAVLMQPTGKANQS